MARMILISLTGHLLVLPALLLGSRLWLDPGRMPRMTTVYQVSLVAAAPRLLPPPPLPPPRPPQHVPPVPSLDTPAGAPRGDMPARGRPEPPPDLAPRGTPPMLQEWWKRQVAGVRVPAEAPVAPRGASRAPASPPASPVTALSIEGPPFPFPSYLGSIQGKITSHWAPPGIHRIGRETVAVVAFLLAPNGRVSRLMVEQGSGAPAYDEAALRAVHLAEPLPPFPEGFRESSLRVHFRFGVRRGP